MIVVYQFMIRLESGRVLLSGNKKFQETAWVDNKFIFRDERFEDLAAMMEKRYNVSIVISSGEVKAYRLTGIFKNESAEEALKVLQVIAPFKYSMQHDSITIYR